MIKLKNIISENVWDRKFGEPLPTLKLEQEEVNVYVAGFFRFLFGLLIIFPYMLKSNFTVFKTNHHKKHFLRAVLNLPSMLLYFSALVMMPIEKATAISFVVPFIVTILAVLFLGEKIYIYRSFALVLGFIGMLIILRPGIIEISTGVYMALASSFMWSVVIIITKSIAKDDSSITILSYGYTYMTIFSFIIALFHWQTPGLQTLIYLFFGSISFELITCLIHSNEPVYFCGFFFVLIVFLFLFINKIICFDNF